MTVHGAPLGGRGSHTPSPEHAVQKKSAGQLPSSSTLHASAVVVDGLVAVVVTVVVDGAGVVEQHTPDPSVALGAATQKRLSPHKGPLVVLQNEMPSKLPPHGSGMHSQLGHPYESAPRSVPAGQSPQIVLAQQMLFSAPPGL